MATTSVTTQAQQAQEFFVGKGWTPAQAAGLVGNFQAESGVNLKPNAVGDGGSAYGIAQWQGPRQADFQAKYGFPIQQANLNQQLEFVNYELTQGKEQAAGARLRATTTAGEAAAVTDQYYERSSGIHRQKRIDYANSLYAGRDPTVTPPPTTQAEIDANSGTSSKIEPAAEPATETAPGQTGFYKIPGGRTNNIPLADQPDSVDTSKPLPNVLNQFPSYIYALSLHLLSAQEYNNVINSGTYKPNRVLVASAGRYNNIPGVKQFIRSPYFAEDFYFDEFTMTTVIGTNSHSRNTNAIEMAFTLLEPYGMTLINRLLDQANDPELNCSNYLDMVYLLQIDFFASNDAGEIVGIVPGITKRFPIKLTQMNIKAGVRGSEYQIQAVPYNHSAFDQTTVSTPANFELVAGSVGEMFQSGADTNPQKQVTSLPGALNGWQNDLVKNNKIGVPDTYAFNIDPTIADSALTSASTLSARDTSMANPLDTNSIRQSNLGTSTQDYNALTRTVGINAGTSIDKIIDNAVRNSDYIKNQIAIPDGVDPQAYLQQKAQQQDQPLNWYRTTPTVTLGEFDPIRKVYSRNITYNVQPYTIYNVKSDVAPQGKVTNFVKSYNYIYTGKNDDVIDFDINFNTLYYTAQTAYRDAVASIYKAPSKSDAGTAQNPGNYQGQVQRPNSVMPMVMKPQVYNARARATGGSISSKDVAVADLEDSLMTLSAADMLSVNLKILGDPQFLKQDDCFYTPSTITSIPTNDPRLTGNGSLRTDYGEIYVLLTFRTPTDIDENTGLMKFSQNYRTSVFSGLYKVLTVQSEFRSGQFTQTLNLIRLPNQTEYDYVNQPQNSNDQRLNDLDPNTTAPLNTNSLVQNVPPPAPSQLISEVASQQPAQSLFTEQVPPLLDSVQQQLINVNNTAPTELINTSNQPEINTPILT